MERAVFFTGHRPPSIGGYDTPAYRQVHVDVHNFLLRTILNWYQADEPITTYITGMAQGIDQIAANAVLEVKATLDRIRLIAAIPYANQSDWWKGNSPAQYHNLLEKCDEIHVVNANPNMSVRADAAKKLELRNRFMVRFPHHASSPEGAEQFAAHFPQLAHLVVQQTLVPTVTVAGIAISTTADKGGTANCIRYAKRKGVATLVVNPFDVNQFNWR